MNFSAIAKKITIFFGSVWVTLSAFAFIVLWVLGGIFYFGFGEFYQIFLNSVTTVMTFLAVFLIQHTQNLELTAIQIKLDEIILSKQHADNKIMNVEDLTEPQLEALRKRYADIAEAHRKLTQ